MTVQLKAVNKGVFVEGRLSLAAFDGDKLVGCVDLFDHSPLHLRAEVGIVVSPPLRGKGYGAAMLRAVEKLARDTLRLHQLYCTIRTDNKVSLALFDGAGYERVGLLRDWVYEDGTYLDAIRMQKIISNP